MIPFQTKVYTAGEVTGGVYCTTFVQKARHYFQRWREKKKGSDKFLEIGLFLLPQCYIILRVETASFLWVAMAAAPQPGFACLSYFADPRATTKALRNSRSKKAYGNSRNSSTSFLACLLLQQFLISGNSPHSAMEVFRKRTSYLLTQHILFKLFLALLGEFQHFFLAR